MTGRDSGDVGLRLPAEWEPQGGVMMMWPHEATDWAPMLDEVCECFAEIGRAIADVASLLVVAPDTSRAREALAGHPHAGRIYYFDCPTNDTWARDAGPLCVSASCRSGMGWRVVDFRFNGWGGKFPAELDDRVTQRLVSAGMLRGRHVDRSDFVLEGGSIDTNGEGTILTTSRCLLSPSRNAGLAKRQIEERLADSLGASRVVWLDHGGFAGDDTDGHIDTLARFAPGDTIVYAGCDDPADVNYEELLAMKRQLGQLLTAAGRPYRLVELPSPDPIYDEEGNRLPATYANFLIINATILMPSYGQPAKDQLAARTVGEAFPGHRVRMVDCRPLIEQHGSLHCVTMQLPVGVLPS